jgi:hypothetical protein
MNPAAEFAGIAPLPASDEFPGSPDNLAGLARLLRLWRCCGAPNHCGAACLDDELSAALATAERVVRERLMAGGQVSDGE